MIFSEILYRLHGMRVLRILRLSAERTRIWRMRSRTCWISLARAASPSMSWTGREGGSRWRRTSSRRPSRRRNLLWSKRRTKLSALAWNYNR